MHFTQKHRCCQKGKVWIEPFTQMPEPMKSALFQNSSSLHTEFLRNPIGYNTVFAFGSIQYQRLQSAPFGLPVIKSQGPTRHYRSAVQPNFGHPNMYGNFYMYEGIEAANKRRENFNSLNSEVILMN